MNFRTMRTPAARHRLPAEMPSFVGVRGELAILMRNLDRSVLPRLQRRRSNRKSHAHRDGNLVTFPRGLP